MPARGRSKIRHRYLTPALVIFMALTATATVAEASNLSAKGVSHVLSVSTSTFLVAPVADPTSPNPSGTSYSVAVVKKSTYYLYLKNFGTDTIKSFTATLSISAALSYCVNQLFQAGSFNTCADTSAAVSLAAGANTTSFANETLTTPLPTTASYEFAIRTPSTTTPGTQIVSIDTVVSQSHTPANTVG